MAEKPAMRLNLGVGPMKSIDAWLVREPAISESEWQSALTQRKEFVTVEAPLGRTPAGQTIVLPKLYLWQGCSSGEVAFAYSPNGIHVSPLDAEAWVLVQELAEQLSATVIEG